MRKRKTTFEKGLSGCDAVVWLGGALIEIMFGALAWASWRESLDRHLANSDKADPGSALCLMIFSLLPDALILFACSLIRFEWDEKGLRWRTGFQWQSIAWAEITGFHDTRGSSIIVACDNRIPIPASHATNIPELRQAVASYAVNSGNRTWDTPEPPSLRGVKLPLTCAYWTMASQFVMVSIIWLVMAGLIAAMIPAMQPEERRSSWDMFAFVCLVALLWLVGPFRRRHETVVVSESGIRYSNRNPWLDARWDDLTAFRRIPSGRWMITACDQSFVIHNSISQFVKFRKALAYYRPDLCDGASAGKLLPITSLILTILATLGIAFAVVEPILWAAHLPLDFGRVLTRVGIALLTSAVSLRIWTVCEHWDANDAGISHRTLLGANSIEWDQVECIRITPQWIRVIGAGQSIQFGRLSLPGGAELTSVILKNVDSSKVIGR